MSTVVEIGSAPSAKTPDKKFHQDEETVIVEERGKKNESITLDGRKKKGSLSQSQGDVKVDLGGVDSPSENRAL